MDDKETKIQKKRVQKYLDKWIGPMGLKWNTIDILWSRDEATDCAANTIFGQWMYHRFTITFHLKEIKDMSDELVENIVVHELCHILTAPLANNMRNSDEDEKYRTDLIEDATETLAKAFLWVRADAEKSK